MLNSYLAMRRHHQATMFRNIIGKVNPEEQGWLSLEFSRYQVSEELATKRILEDMEKRITDRVLAKLDVSIEDRASVKIQELLNDISKLK